MGSIPTGLCVEGLDKPICNFGCAVGAATRSKKMASLEGSTHHFDIKVSSDEIAQVDSGYIGYAFTDPVTGDTYIYWYPADVVLDPSGAEIYVSPV